MHKVESKQIDVSTLCEKIDFLFGMAKYHKERFRIIAAKEDYEPILITFPVAELEKKIAVFDLFAANKFSEEDNIYAREHIGDMYCWNNHYKEGDIYISNINIHCNQYKNRGIGTQALIALMDHARILNRSIIYLDKDIRREQHKLFPNRIIDANLLFYENVGFKRTTRNGDTMAYSLTDNKPIDYKEYFNLISNLKLRKKYLSVNA